MADSVLILGGSGSGKSTSGRNLDPKETFWLNVANKSLPFKGSKKSYTKIGKENPKGNMSSAHTPKGIIDVMNHVSEKRPEIKYLIIDDLQFVSAFEFFNRADEKSYDKFTDIGKALAAIARKPMKLRDDLTVFFMSHIDEFIDAKGVRSEKAKTVGKMVDQNLTLEGLFTMVFYARVIHDDEGELKYVFETRNSGANTCKTPMGMFDKNHIPNDLKYVVDKIEEYQN